MFFKRQEQKRRHPVCGIVVGALATVGVCTVYSMVKQKMQSMCCGMKQLFGAKKKDACCKPMPAEGSCDCEPDMMQN